ncbi:MAG: glycosyltransferase family 2 protein [Chitinophagaceae bacterium]
MLLIFLYFLVSTGYLLIFAFAGRVVQNPLFQNSRSRRNGLVLIPAFREDRIILNTAFAASSQTFNSGTFRVIVIADQMQAETIQRLEAANVTVIEVKFETSSKGRSLNAVLPHINARTDDFIFVLDADNIPGRACLDSINDALDTGYKVVQLHRTAKNTETPVALLDAISEEINLNIFRRGAFNLGLSAAPMGSGMAFDIGVFQDIFSDPETIASASEDRYVENYLIRHNMRLGYLDDALVFDEKVSNTAVLKKQRIRWMEAQLGQLRRFANESGTFGPSNRQYYHSFFQTLLLPRVFYLALSGIICLLLIAEGLWNPGWLYPASYFWLILVLLYWTVLGVSIPGKFYTFRTLKAVFSLPIVILTMLMALFQLKKTRKEFLHTSKSFVAKDQEQKPEQHL